MGEGGVRYWAVNTTHSVLYTQPLKMELTVGSETSANHNLTPGKYPKEYIQHSKHGESLKSRMLVFNNKFNIQFMTLQFPEITGLQDN
jgi:hypothetical protein